MTDLIISIAEQGLIYAVMALGVYITYKILDFPDLSVDGTFPLGAAVTAALITHGVNPWYCLLASAAAGAVAGCITGILNVKLKIKDLLSGILMMTALYSINYRIVGAPNLFLMGEKTIFSSFEFLGIYRYVIVTAVIVIVIKYLLDWYLRTKSGFLVRCSGDNEGLVITLGKNPGTFKIIALAIANSLSSLAGALNCQRFMQFDISSGTGTIVMGLAAVIIGTAVFPKTKFIRTTTSVVFGMIIYKLCISLALKLGLMASDTNLVVTILFVLTLIASGALKKSGTKSIGKDK